MRDRGLAKLVAQVQLRAPGAPRLRTGSALSFHSLRRTARTLLHEAGIPAAVAQALIGHDSAAMHEIYISVGREALVKAAAAFPEVQ
jgi:integrase